MRLYPNICLNVLLFCCLFKKVCKNKLVDAYFIYIKEHYKLWHCAISHKYTENVRQKSSCLMVLANQSKAMYIKAQRSIHTHIHTYGQYRRANWPNPNVFGLWKENWAPGGYPSSTEWTCKLNTEGPLFAPGIKKRTCLLRGDQKNSQGKKNNILSSHKNAKGYIKGEPGTALFHPCGSSIML